MVMLLTSLPLPWPKSAQPLNSNSYFYVECKIINPIVELKLKILIMQIKFIKFYVNKNLFDTSTSYAILF